MNITYFQNTIQLNNVWASTLYAHKVDTVFFAIVKCSKHAYIYILLALVPTLRAGHITVWEPKACTFKLHVTYLLKL